jgi:hypothetical protein
LGRGLKRSEKQSGYEGKSAIKKQCWQTFLVVEMKENKGKKCFSARFLEENDVF